jgi:hypothetical protein
MTTQPCNWCESDGVDPHDFHHSNGECRLIGVLANGQDTLCLSCAQFTEGDPIRWGAYPDGFTCVECGDVVADENYKGGEE